jgi:hypothetical protein
MRGSRNAILQGFTSLDPPEERVRSSNYLITVSTNKRTRSQEAISEIIKELYDGLEYAFGKKECIASFLNMMEAPMKTFWTHVGKVDSVGVIEYHHRSGVHAHVLMTICHITKVRLDVPPLVECILSQMSIVKNVYVSVSYVRNEVQNVRNYIYKTIQGKRLKMCDGSPYPEDGNVHVTCKISIGNMTSYGFISETTSNVSKRDEYYKRVDDPGDEGHPPHIQCQCDGLS